jgi:uncharacterized protein YjbJ (UPF0337 family)
MRILLAAPLLLLGACDLDRDAANDTTTLSFNETVAGNTLKDVGNAAENFGGVIANEAEETAGKIENEVGDVDVDVDVDRDRGGNSQ